MAAWNLSWILERPEATSRARRPGEKFESRKSSVANNSGLKMALSPKLPKLLVFFFVF